jgi:hypothetical protein
VKVRGLLNPPIRERDSSIARKNSCSIGGALFEDRPGMTQSIICQRAFEFAVRIAKLCENMSTRGDVRVVEGGEGIRILAAPCGRR